MEQQSETNSHPLQDPADARTYEIAIKQGREISEDNLKIKDFLERSGLLSGGGQRSGAEYKKLGNPYSGFRKTLLSHSRFPHHSRKRNQYMMIMLSKLSSANVTPFFLALRYPLRYKILTQHHSTRANTIQKRR
jgi:hypothetical protein